MDAKQKKTIQMSITAFAAIIVGVIALTVFNTLMFGKPRGSSSQKPEVVVDTIAQSAANQATVPRVVGLEAEHARMAINNAGLKVGEITEDYSDTVPKGNVISTNPEGGTVADKETPVNMVISKGRQEAAEISMPNLIGKTQLGAEKALRDAKLVPVIGQPVVSTTVEPGKVCTQSVAAGTMLKEGTQVSFSIAIAPETIEVPNLAGKTLTDANNQLKSLGLTTDVTRVYTDKVEKDKVVTQSVAAGTKVAKGTVVTLTVSLGAQAQKPAETVAVPNVSGMKLADAQAELKKVGLISDTAKAYSDTIAKDGIIAQSIAAGTKVTKGTKVTLTVSLGKEPVADTTVAVPNVTGKKLADAQAELKKAGLGFDSSAREYSDSVPADSIISQSIPAGTKVSKDTVVRLTVSLGAKPAPEPVVTLVKVPNIMTYTCQEAIDALESAGLDYRYSGDESGTVIHQDIEANTEVEKGTIVTFTLRDITSLTEIPDVYGMKAEEAFYLLQSVGLELVYDESRPEAILDGTDPVAGALIEEGEQVNAVYREDEEEAPADEEQADDQQADESVDQGDEQATDQADDQAQDEAQDQVQDEAQDQAQDEANVEQGAEENEGQEEQIVNEEAKEEAQVDPGTVYLVPREVLKKLSQDSGKTYELVETLSTTQNDAGISYTFVCRVDGQDYTTVVEANPNGDVKLVSSELRE